MVKKMKCTNCGGNEFIECVISTDGMGVGDRVTTSVSNASTFACRQCGHIEWYLSEQAFKAHDQREKQKTEYQAELAKYEQKKRSLESEIERLRKIIADENQTVKAVNDAKAKLGDLEYELMNLREPTEQNGAGFYW